MKKRPSLKFMAIVVIVLIAFFFLNFFSGFGGRVGAPLWRARDSFTDIFSDAVNILRSKTKLSEENRELKRELVELRAQNILSRTFKERADELEKILSIKRADSVVSRVLSKPPQSPYDTLIIDKGLTSGIEKGDRVYAGDEYVLGFVSDVYKETSKIELFSRPGNKMTLEKENGETLEAEGLGGGNFLIKIPRSFEIEEREAVFYPHGSLSIVGFIEEIESRPKDPFKSVYVKSPVNVGALKWVEIVK